MKTKLILASTSPYRRELLQRLGLPFATQAPQADENPLPGETPEALACRLAHAKAAAVAAGLSAGGLVIGSDQVAVCDGQIFGKPGDLATARAQLATASGRELHFFTAVCLLTTASGQRQDHLDNTRVSFRDLEPAEIDRYLEREQPFNCAGSFKSEGLGISLCTAIETRDPTALIGLPLIAVAQMLRTAGVVLP